MGVEGYDVRNVLVADDDPLTLELLRFALRRASWTVETCADGQAALNLCFSRRFAIAILDINMPFMTGLEVLEAIQQSGGVPGLSVLMLSAQDLPRDRVRSDELGAEGFIPKPMDMESVLDMMSSCASQEITERLAT